MKAGDIVLAELPQSNDFKLRPVLVLKLMPPHNDFLLCGISTQISQAVADFDEIIAAEDSESLFEKSVAAASLPPNCCQLAPRRNRVCRLLTEVRRHGGRRYRLFKLTLTSR